MPFTRQEWIDRFVAQLTAVIAEDYLAVVSASV